MKRILFMFGLAMLAGAGPVLAEKLREISAPELRQIVAAGNTISLKRAIDSVVKATKGEPLEARAFQADGIFYRIVLKKPDGTLFSVIINAVTGEQVTKNSSIGKQVTAAAAAGSKAKADKSKAEAAKTKNAAGGNGNSGGSGSSGGNGNSGGSGNSGGNSGGGNSGGNGGGNGNGKN
jgi:phage baseplate assembly protein gpV